MTPRDPGDAEMITLDRIALHKSERAGRSGTPLLRGEAPEQSDSPSIQVPLPLAEVRESDTVRILHVDDEPEIGALMAQFLERLEDTFEVHTESTVVAALDTLEEQSIDCVVSDYQMPNTDGLEFLEIVRDRYPDLPFILFTGHGSEEIASDAIAAGVTDYMRKGSGPDTYEVLANRIQNAVEQYRTQEQFWNALSWYRRLVEQEITGVFIMQDSEFVYVNRTLADTFDRSQADLIGESPLTFVDEDDHDHVLETLLEHAEYDEDSFQVSFAGERADGGTVAVDVHCGAIDYNGEPAWIGILDEAGESGTDC